MRARLIRSLCCLVVGVAAASLQAQDLAGYERVLLPVSTYFAPGAHGTLWSTELWFRNNSGRPAQIFPTIVSHWSAPVGTTDTVPVFKRPLETPGQFLFVTRANAAQVQFDLRLFNEVARHDGWGTKLPVVREAQYASVVNLINVPVGPAYRSALRIYGLPEHAPASDSVIVRLYSNSGSEPLLATTELPFDATLVEIPQYAAIMSLSDSLPDMRAAEQIRVEVTSRSGTARIWAFVSVVSNSSQEVSLVTPD